MSSLTSGSTGIGDTGSRNSTYISGLVMMDVMLSCCKGRLVRCRRWDSIFYLSSLLLGDSRRSNWRVTTLVPFLLSFISCVFLVYLWREAWRICALLLPGPSVLSFVLVNPLYFVSGLLLRYDAGTDWVYFTSYAFLVYLWWAARCVDTALPSISPCLLLSSWKCVKRGLLWRRRCQSAIFTFFVVFVLIFREELIGVSMLRLTSVFLLFSCRTC